jgi:hypothetical protein
MTVAPPEVTALYGAPLAVLAVGLGAWIVTLRVRLGVGIGDGGHRSLARAIRAHANLLETAPIAILLLLLAELTGAVGHGALHAAGGLLLAGRLLHALGLLRSSGASPPRFLGMLATWSTTLGLAAALLYRGLA